MQAFPVNELSEAPSGQAPDLLINNVGWKNLECVPKFRNTFHKSYHPNNGS